ncbi:hypothetical protein SAMN02799622_01362 [Methylobacterium sp. UNC378MF]|uniref:hypothetical protein n=1 Tax=Methylobacterium sp. UNC378MF TaxID=1502748 RepID=UPI0008922FB8|nr:hypothetical protein [Methylobacterium sp. UNC378MF]SDA15662.1 hypothetical protein SAMN02799622_01362 [Methylobacterium sp. UNC378MF]
MRALALALMLAACPAAAEEAINGTLPADPVKRVALLAGAAAFVESNCQTLRPDWKAVQIAVAANNFHADALGKPPLVDEIRREVATWRFTNANLSCETIEALFGPNGASIEGLVVRGR